MPALVLAATLPMLQSPKAAPCWATAERLATLVGRSADEVHDALGDPVDIRQAQIGEGPKAVEVALFYYV